MRVTIRWVMFSMLCLTETRGEGDHSMGDVFNVVSYRDPW